MSPLLEREIWGGCPAPLFGCLPLSKMRGGLFSLDEPEVSLVKVKLKGILIEILSDEMWREGGGAMLF